MFPQAKFIHIIRDGRATASSYYERVSTGKFGNWMEREWWIRGWPKQWQSEFLTEYNLPPIEPEWYGCADLYN